MYIEHPLASSALKMMVMAVVSHLIHGSALRQMNLMQQSITSHRFERPVHGRNSQPR